MAELKIVDHDVPHELLDLAIIDRLSNYCEVISHRRGRFKEPAGVFNGLRHYRVRILQPIASYLRIGKWQIVLKHDRQVETCQRYNLSGHYAHSCHTVTCFNCAENGHQAATCPMPQLCSICRRDTQLARSCPHSWHRLSVCTPLHEPFEVDPPSVNHPEEPPRPDEETTPRNEEPLQHIKESR